MSETTGTIIASIIAFVSAVIGAVIAGIYAKRGAEVGGRKAVEAALAQVHGQAAVEHWQWVRSQRHQSFAALLEAYAALDDVLTRIAPEVQNGARLDEATGRELRESALALQDKTSLLALWGPHEASELAYALMRKATSAVGTLLRVAAARSTDQNADWASSERARNEMITAYAGFLQRAGEIIRDPLQPVS
ncbi:hypothetical protein R6V09_23050 [Streptomyces sp. W16]|uniref:hypothetical protein n=1 Tax=Streptomyces sp. W16 TaxID=3076631 RepID=UPI00295BF179|nr:hypothetical protein [Streptomyces sp. W16]MDV9172979.1 hypothetical protein [Streptomyces sp. W16]